MTYEEYIEKLKNCPRAEWQESFSRFEEAKGGPIREDRITQGYIVRSLERDRYSLLADWELKDKTFIKLLASKSYIGIQKYLVGSIIMHKTYVKRLTK